MISDIVIAVSEECNSAFMKFIDIIWAGLIDADYQR